MFGLAFHALREHKKAEKYVNFVESNLELLDIDEKTPYERSKEKVQHSTGDITPWLEWFLDCLKNAMFATEDTTQRILRKAEFWKLHESTSINERQRSVLNKLFDGFEGKLQTSKKTL